MFVLIRAICSTHGFNSCFILSKYDCNSSTTFSILAMRLEKESIPEFSLLRGDQRDERMVDERNNEKIARVSGKNIFLNFEKSILKNGREGSGHDQDPKPSANP